MTLLKKNIRLFFIFSILVWRNSISAQEKTKRISDYNSREEFKKPYLLLKLGALAHMLDAIQKEQMLCKLYEKLFLQADRYLKTSKDYSLPMSGFDFNTCLDLSNFQYTHSRQGLDLVFAFKQAGKPEYPKTLPWNKEAGSDIDEYSTSDNQVYVAMKNPESAQSEEEIKALS